MRSYVVGTVRWLAGFKLGQLQQHAPRLCTLPSAGPPLRAGELAPAICIVTPVRNQATFIADTVRSVLDQRYPVLEYVVKDGASTDGTVAALAPLRQRLTHLVSEADGGQSAAINAGFALTTAPIMAYLNGDDLLLPNALHVVGRFFAENEEVDVVYGHRLLIDEQGRLIGRWILPPHEDGVLSWADFVPQETLFWRRRLWERVGGIDESFRFAMDWDLLLRFRDAGARMVRLDACLGAFRVHAAQKTSAQMRDLGWHEMRRILEREHGGPVPESKRRRAILPYLIRHRLHDISYAWFRGEHNDFPN